MVNSLKSADFFKNSFFNFASKNPKAAAIVAIATAILSSIVLCVKFLGRSKTVSTASAQPPIIGPLTSQEQELNVPIHYQKNALKPIFCNIKNSCEFTAHGYYEGQIGDKGNNCALRCIQTLTDHRNLHLTFDELVETCSRKDENRLDGPSIAKNILSKNNTSSDLFFINKELDCTKPMRYPAFKVALKNHFLKPAPKPVMIDNGSFAYCIVGIGSPAGSNDFHLAIMDPHIKQGARMAEGSDAQHVGVYTITLDAEGRQTHVNDFPVNELSEEFLSPYQNPMSLQRLSFNNVREEGPKNDWTVLFPASSC